MQALLITLGAFALILVLARLKLPLAAAILIGAIACGVGFRMEPGRLVVCIAEAVVRPRTICLMIIVSCLMGLSGTMQAGGQMARIVELARMALRRPAVTMAALPALIGMLPMPGGALFSAPMVESAAGGEKVPPGKMSAINYWFRHVWEYWWPLFPGVIVAVGTTGVGLGNFALFHFPLSVISILAGLVIFRKTHPNLHVKSSPPPEGTKRSFVKATSSIWMVLLVWGAVKLVIVLLLGSSARHGGSAAPAGYTQFLQKAIYTYLPIMAGIVVSLVFTTIVNKIDRAAARKIWTDRRIRQMVLLVGGVMVFQHVLDQADAPARIAEELTAMKVPVVAVFAILPLVAGLVMGIAVGFVGTSFPILIGMLAAWPDAGDWRPYIALAYLFGHMGQMISPLHLCHVVSNKYFKTSFGPVYAQLLPVVVLTVVGGVAYIAVLMLVLN